MEEEDPETQPPASEFEAADDAEEEDTLFGVGSVLLARKYSSEGPDLILEKSIIVFEEEEEEEEEDEVLSAAARECHRFAATQPTPSFLGTPTKRLQPKLAKFLAI